MSEKFEDQGLDACYVVIFTSVKKDNAQDYEETAKRMLDLVATQEGFLGSRSFRDCSGEGITISYWNSLESIRSWRQHKEHQAAISRGISEWYSWYKIEIAELK